MRRLLIILGFISLLLSFPTDAKAIKEEVELYLRIVEPGKESTHIAFSFYVDDDDDEVLDVYGIRDWVENLPEKRVTISSLANHYNIIGL
jgi:hypothetical protein